MPWDLAHPHQYPGYIGMKAFGGGAGAIWVEIGGYTWTFPPDAEILDAFILPTSVPGWAGEVHILGHQPGKYSFDNYMIGESDIGPSSGTHKVFSPEIIRRWHATTKKPPKPKPKIAPTLIEAGPELPGLPGDIFGVPRAAGDIFGVQPLGQTGPSGAPFEFMGLGDDMGATLGGLFGRGGSIKTTFGWKGGAVVGGITYHGSPFGGHGKASSGSRTWLPGIGFTGSDSSSGYGGGEGSFYSDGRPDPGEKPEKGGDKVIQHVMQGKGGDKTMQEEAQSTPAKRERRPDRERVEVEILVAGPIQPHQQTKSGSYDPEGDYSDESVPTFVSSPGRDAIGLAFATGWSVSGGFGRTDGGDFEGGGIGAGAGDFEGEIEIVDPLWDPEGESSGGAGMDIGRISSRSFWSGGGGPVTDTTDFAGTAGGPVAPAGGILGAIGGPDGGGGPLVGPDPAATGGPSFGGLGAVLGSASTTRGGVVASTGTALGAGVASGGKVSAGTPTSK